jgi:hypothetical protein
MRDLQQRQADEIKALEAELAGVRQRLDDAERTHDIQMQAAQRRLDDEADSYTRAVEAWEDN